MSIRIVRYVLKGLYLKIVAFFSGATRHLVGNELAMAIFTLHRLHGFGSIAARCSSACGTTPSWSLEAVRLLELVLLCLEITLR